MRRGVRADVIVCVIGDGHDGKTGHPWLTNGGLDEGVQGVRAPALEAHITSCSSHMPRINSPRIIFGAQSRMAISWESNAKIVGSVGEH